MCMWNEERKTFFRRHLLQCLPDLSLPGGSKEPVIHNKNRSQTMSYLWISTS